MAPSQKLYLTLKPYLFGVYDLPEKEDCLAHELWEPVEVIEQSVTEMTPRMLLEFVGEPTGRVDLGFDLLTEMRCVVCDNSEAVLRPLEQCSLELALCTYCGTRSRQPDAVNGLDGESPYADVSLGRLGMPDGGVVRIQGEVATRFLQLAGGDCFASAGKAEP
jgi:hypothetical protein